MPIGEFKIKRFGKFLRNFRIPDCVDLELTDWHFEVLAAVRQFYQQFGHSPATRPLIKFGLGIPAKRLK
jgi:sulfur relay (sulfurtransferase) DsrC/TusE family protein